MDRDPCKRLGTALFVVSLVGALAGCSALGRDPDTSAHSAAVTAKQREALDKYAEAQRAQVPRLMKAYGDIYSHADVKEVYPGTVELRYQFAKKLGSERALAFLKHQQPVLESLCKTDLLPSMEQAGVHEPKADLIYLNGDGSTLWSYRCTP